MSLNVCQVQDSIVLKFYKDSEVEEKCEMERPDFELSGFLQISKKCFFLFFKKFEQRISFNEHGK